MADAKSGERGERLKAALRENLKRRKAQVRERQAAEPKPAEPAPDEAPRALKDEKA